MSFVYRKATEADREKYVDFANMVFSCADEPHDFQKLIPKVYDPSQQTAYMHNIAVRDDGSVRGVVAVMPGVLNVMGTELKYGYVGTVSVHPYSRGEGHMKKLMAMAIEGMEAEGVDISMLGGQRQRYEYFGFTNGGVMRTHTVSKTNLRHALGNASTENIAITDVKPDDGETLEKCCALNSGRKTFSRRTPEDFFAVSQTWNNVLKAVSVDGEFAGYMIVNGDSFGEIMLNEWENTTLVLKKYMEISGFSALRISTGDYELELNRALAGVEERTSIEHSEMLRIFNFPKVVDALMKLKASYAPLADGMRSFVIDGKPMTVRVCGGHVEVTEEALEGAEELSAMQAQHMFMGIDGELLASRLPLGWAPLPLYMSDQDAF